MSVPLFSNRSAASAFPSGDTLGKVLSIGMISSGSPPKTGAEKSAYGGFAPCGFFPRIITRLLSGDHPATYQSCAPAVRVEAVGEFRYRRNTRRSPGTPAAYANAMPSGDQTPAVGFSQETSMGVYR